MKELLLEETLDLIKKVIKNTNQDSEVEYEIIPPGRTAFSQENPADKAQQDERVKSFHV